MEGEGERWPSAATVGQTLLGCRGEERIGVVCRVCGVRSVRAPGVRTLRDTQPSVELRWISCTVMIYGVNVFAHVNPWSESFMSLSVRLSHTVQSAFSLEAAGRLSSARVPSGHRIMIGKLLSWPSQSEVTESTVSNPSLRYTGAPSSLASR